MASRDATRVTSSGRSRRLTALIALALALGSSQWAARPSGAAPAGLNGPAGVSLTVDVDLQDLHPAVSQGALNCGAVVQTPDWIAAHRADLIDYDSFVKWVIYAAHYLGQESKATFPVTGRRYAGTLHVSLTLSPSAFVDPATRAAWSPAPQALIACWLMLNDRPAIWDRNGAALVASATNFASVTASPLVVAIVPAAPSAAVSAATRLHTQGHFFVPGRVALSANVQIGGSSSASPGSAMPRTALAAPAQLTAAPTHARKAPGPGQTATPAPTPIVLQTQFDAGGGFVAPVALTANTTLAGGGVFVAPTATVLQTPLNGTGGFVTPLSAVIETQLNGAGNFATPPANTTPPGSGSLAPVAAVIQTQLNGAGGFVAPLSLSLDTALSSSGGFVLPTATTLQATLTAGGNFATGSP